MGRVFKPERVDRRTGRKVKYRNWYCEWQVLDGETYRTCRKKIGPDRALAVEALARFEELERRKRLSLPEPAAVPGEGKAIAVLVGEYVAVLAGRDTTPEYRDLVDDYLTRLSTGCKWHSFNQVTADSLTVYLGKRRDEHGNSPATLNSYLRIAKGFANWVARKAKTESPLAGIPEYPEEVDRRRSKRILTDTEFAALVAAARAAPRKGRAVFRGPDRAVLYTVAAFSGLRAGELAELTPAHFALDAEVPTVTVGARDAKGKREEPIPLPGHVAELLRGYLAGKARHERIWPGNWARRRHQVEWLRRDLARSGVAERDEKGRRVTFHSLKRRFVVRLIEAGGLIHEVRRMARHKDVKTTLNYYTDTDLKALGELANRLKAAG